MAVWPGLSREVRSDRWDAALLADSKRLLPRPVRNRVHTQIGVGRNSIHHEPQIESNALCVVVLGVVGGCEDIEIHMRSHAIAHANIRVVVRCIAAAGCISTLSNGGGTRRNRVEK